MRINFILCAYFFCTFFALFCFLPCVAKSVPPAISKKFEIRGYLSSQSGALSRVEVVLVRFWYDKEEDVDKTNAKGGFSLAALHKGLFWLKIQHRGYHPVRLPLLLEQPGVILVRLVLAPKTSHITQDAGLLDSSIQPKVHFHPARAQRFFNIFTLYRLAYGKFFASHRKHLVGGQILRFSFDWTPYRAKLRKYLAAETDPTLRNMLLLLQCIRQPRAYSPLLSKRNRKSEIRRLLRAISARSPLWEMDRHLIRKFLEEIGISTTESQQFTHRFLSRDTNLMLRWRLRYTLMLQALSRFRHHTYLQKRKMERQADHQSQAQTHRTIALEHFEALSGLARQSGSKLIRLQTEEARRHMYSKLPLGAKVPSFHVTLLDGNKKLSLEELKGHHVLIVFWVTWCSPCLAKMPLLHKLYKTFYHKGLRILSISLDTNPTLVRQFRKKRWNMPWYNVVDTDGDDSSIARRFEVSSLPAMYLLSPDGRIVARGALLENKRLLNVIQDSLKP